MKTRLQKRVKNEKGLTLVELLAVIVILGIIAAIAVPSIGKIIENTKYNAVKADAINALNAANLYFAESLDPDNTTTENVKVADLVGGGYLQNAGKLAEASGTNVHEIDYNGGALQITANKVVYSGSKEITFTKATLDDITKDKQKGSSGTQLKPIPTP